MDEYEASEARSAIGTAMYKDGEKVVILEARKDGPWFIRDSHQDEFYTDRPKLSNVVLFSVEE